MNVFFMFMFLIQLTLCYAQQNENRTKKTEEQKSYLSTHLRDISKNSALATFYGQYEEESKPTVGMLLTYFTKLDESQRRSLIEELVEYKNISSNDNIYFIHVSNQVLKLGDKVFTRGGERIVLKLGSNAALYNTLTLVDFSLKEHRKFNYYLSPRSDLVNDKIDFKSLSFANSSWVLKVSHFRQWWESKHSKDLTKDISKDPKDTTQANEKLAEISTRFRFPIEEIIKYKKLFLVVDYSRSMEKDYDSWIDFIRTLEDICKEFNIDLISRAVGDPVFGVENKVEYFQIDNSKIKFEYPSSTGAHQGKFYYDFKQLSSYSYSEVREKIQKYRSDFDVSSELTCLGLCDYDWKFRMKDFSSEKKVFGSSLARGLVDAQIDDSTLIVYIGDGFCTSNGLSIVPRDSVYDSYKKAITSHGYDEIKVFEIMKPFIDKIMDLNNRFYFSNDDEKEIISKVKTKILFKQFTSSPYEQYFNTVKRPGDLVIGPGFTPITSNDMDEIKKMKRN